MSCPTLTRVSYAGDVPLQHPADEHMLDMIDALGWRAKLAYHVAAEPMSYDDFAFHINRMVLTIADWLWCSVKTGGRTLWRLEDADTALLDAAFPSYPCTRAGRRSAELYVRAGILLTSRLSAAAVPDASVVHPTDTAVGCAERADGLVARAGRDAVATEKLRSSSLDI
jgi:hypothetical protein